MDEKDLKREDVTLDKSDENAETVQPEEIKTTEAPKEENKEKNDKAEVGKDNKKASKKAPVDDMVDISFNELFEEDDAKKPELKMDQPEEEPDSDIIVPQKKSRVDVSEKHNSNAKTDAKPAKANEDKKKAAEFVYDLTEEEDLKIIRDNDSKKKSKKKKKKAKAPKVNNSVFGGLIIISVILTASILLAYGGIKLGMEYLGIGKNSNNITFNIPDGATSDDVIKLLQENDIITQPKLFSVIMKMKDKTFYPGDITLKPSMSYSAIIDVLSENRESRDTVTITFQEGITLRDAAALLEDNKVCSKKDFIFEFNKNQGFDFESLIEESDLTFYKMEGFFFPDTYDFYLEDDAYNVARIIKERFSEKFTANMENAMKQSGFNLNELITLASMVQREAGTKKDMPIVASVFINRLDNAAEYPSLESDATSNYITQVIKKEAGTNLSIKHFTESYDTYHCKGLPAGAICNPGLDAIDAVLNPEETKYFFFCNNLDTGKAYYAETLKQHEKNLVKAGLVEAE